MENCQGVKQMLLVIIQNMIKPLYKTDHFKQVFISYK